MISPSLSCLIYNKKDIGSLALILCYYWNRGMNNNLKISSKIEKNWKDLVVNRQSLRMYFLRFIIYLIYRSSLSFFFFFYEVKYR